MFLTNMVMSMFIGTVLVGLLFYYPLSLGFERALAVKNKVDCIRAGMHKPFTLKKGDTATTYL